MKMFAKMLMMVCVALFLGAGIAQAAPYQFQGGWVEVDYWAGTGTNETIVVVDWNGTNGPYSTEAHAWGYRWDGDKSVQDALDAIDAAGALIVTGSGFINGLDYNQTSVDGDNHTNINHLGWVWLGQTTDFGANWTANSGGTTGEMLVDGNIEGLNLDGNNWTNSNLTIPVPEPATLGLLGIGGLALLRRRSRKA